MLVVDDELPMRNVVRRILTKHGYSVLLASSGDEALRLWHENKGTIDLVLTDLTMPEGMGGRELAKQLRAIEPAVRIVFSSGYYENVSTDELALNPGVNFLSKPYTPAELLKVVATACAAEP